MFDKMESDLKYMQRALELAKRGEGVVEPNPMVGCLIVRDGIVVGEGYHGRFGGPHAEIEAIRAAKDATVGATCYVTLEPCSHHGKTPPCTVEVLRAGFKRLVVAMRDPNPKVSGRGIQLLRNSDLEVVEGVLETEARNLNAPYLSRWEKNRPWVVAKWAMTLDGRLASRTGSSQWISNDASREIVHRLRSRMDAILIGSRTALADDPLLTVRLPEDVDAAPRQPLRIVFDSKATIPLESRLVQTAKSTPVLIVVGPSAPPDRVREIEEAGCEIFRVSSHVSDEDVENNRQRQRDQRSGAPHRSGFHERSENGAPSRADLAYRERFKRVFEFLVQRDVTNLLVEGGSNLFGTLFDLRAIDEAHVFVAPKLIGGDTALGTVGGVGLADMIFAPRLDAPEIQIVQRDVYIHGRVRYPE